jgi:hypothetical protein
VYSAGDREIEERLGAEQLIDLDSQTRRLRLCRLPNPERLIFVEVSGARIVAVPGRLPVSNDPLETTGLHWPGIEGAVTRARATGISLDYVYIDDRVLGDYEGRSEYEVHPESGAVSLGNQWSVSYCARVARDLIRVELKKLYEGVPPAVTRNWNKFAVQPLPATAYPHALDRPNIAKRARALVYSVANLGENLSTLAKIAGCRDHGPKDFAGLLRNDLDYRGWWSFPEPEMIGRHSPVNMTLDAFLDGCMTLIN